MYSNSPQNCERTNAYEIGFFMACGEKCRVHKLRYMWRDESSSFSVNSKRENQTDEGDFEFYPFSISKFMNENQKKFGKYIGFLVDCNGTSRV